jgi:ankyrin repeat protein
MATTKDRPANLQKDLVKAVKTGAADRVREILAQAPSLIQFRDADGSTLLHYAAWKGRADVAAVLIDAGADVNAQDNNGHYGGTPLHAAAHGNQRAVADLLITRGAVLDARSCNGRSPLEETAIHKATAVARRLREAGAVG